MLPALFLFAAQFLPAQPDTLPAKSAQANQLMTAGRFEEAIPLYQQLVKAASGNPGLLLNLGLAQHMAGHEREAIPTLEAVLKTQPNSLPALISLGSARLALNQPSAAIAPLRRALNEKPADHETRGLLASALLGAKRMDEAAEEYRKLTDAISDDPRAVYGLGMTYQAIAEAAFDQLQKAGATSPYVAALVAETRVQRRQFRSGFFFYNEAAKQLPLLHGIHAALADVYRKTGHSDWATEEDAKQALFRLGQLPPSAELHQLRAEIARAQGQHLESVREWREALLLMPGNPRLRRELTESLFLAQDYRAALAEAEAILQADPKSPELNFIAGDSLLRLEQPDKALPYLKTALNSDPKLLAADASLGLALSRLGNHAEAVPHLEKALELDDDGSLYYQLGRAYQALGDREKAAGAMAKYQQILKKTEEQKEAVAREAQIGPPH